MQARGVFFHPFRQPRRGRAGLDAWGGGAIALRPPRPVRRRPGNMGGCAMKWGVFSLSQMPDQSLRAEAFEADCRQFELAEELGYGTIWIAEHLYATYGVVTSTQVLAAAIAMRTRRIAIGTAVVVIPFNHPLRTASD